MKYFAAVLAAIMATGALVYITLNREITEKIPALRAVDEDQSYQSKELTKGKILLIMAAVAIMNSVAVIKILEVVPGKGGQLKMLLALLCMTGAAAVDYREQRIPNLFPLVMALGGTILLIVDFLAGKSGAVDYITTNVITAVCCAAALLLVSVLTKHGIGAGDIKLICALALIAGIYTVIDTLFFGMLLCCVVALAAVLTKRKKMSDAVPFGPFLYFGYIITILVGEF